MLDKPTIVMSLSTLQPKPLLYYPIFHGSTSSPDDSIAALTMHVLDIAAHYNPFKAIEFLRSHFPSTSLEQLDDTTRPIKELPVLSHVNKHFDEQGYVLCIDRINEKVWFLRIK